ncbi:MAG: NTPase [Thermoplasmatales archaeon]|nr:NTPase [Thermoplasmatales archaeon]
MAKGVKIGITGLPSAGKTQALIRVIEMLENEEWVVGGMITEPITKKGKRVGFNVKDWMTKEEDVLAHVKFDSKIKVGKYGVDTDALERIGVKAIEKATEEAEIIVIDEVGKMEVESKKFVQVVKKALETDKSIILTLHKKSRNPLLQDIRRRDDVRILEVTPINRMLLPYKIMKLMRGEML